MKRWIHSATRLSSLDPIEVNKLGYKQVDSGYARDRDDFSRIKQKLSDKYGEVKMYKVASDTPGLMMYEVYAKIED